jgi:NAD(P)-dependent dehydrogenase (short-subunit alcohol dehydrogenase family)
VSTNLSGKTIVVTGASSGIGFQAALDLAHNGAIVIGCGRDAARCEQARARILQNCPGAKIEFIIADLSTQRQVRGLAGQVQLLLAERGRSLDILVNNAGLYSSKQITTEDGIELTFAVNHLAPFLLTHLLLPQLKSTPDGRVITVSSNSHYRVMFNPTRPQDPALYIGIWAYAVSKLSNVLFSAEFNRQVNNPTLHAWAVDPGLVNTDIGLKDKGFFTRLVWRSRQKRGTNAGVPSRTILHLAAAPRENIKDDLYWKDSKPKAPSRLALDPGLALRLWQESCRLCGIEDYFNQA